MDTAQAQVIFLKNAAAQKDKLLEEASQTMFADFLTTKSQRLPRVGDNFPAISLTDLDGKPVTFGTKPVMLVLGKQDSQSINALHDALRARVTAGDLEFVKIVTFGGVSAEPGVRVVDAMEGNTALYSPGRMRSVLGLATPPAAFLVGTDKKVWYARPGGGFQDATELPAALTAMQGGTKLVAARVDATRSTSGLIEGLDADVAQALRTTLEHRGISLVFLTDTDCTTCQGFETEIKSALERWSKAGYALLNVQSGQGTTANQAGVMPLSVDAKDAVSTAFNVVQKPSVVILRNGVYQGVIGYSKVNYLDGFNADGSERMAVHTEPFERAVERAIQLVER